MRDNNRAGIVEKEGKEQIVFTDVVQKHLRASLN